ncbi:hypothetical protein DFH08DRAFT_901949 [Mycena albidolilacea]|uniref:Secreted protein n=1 Tax=Mycena albidolilacea TaxID=1033008 RepID=A0AAD7EA63_9AGAR|nr:hypothetical protein DFH08DRAFT_901949 [Mycena albidolilacea]
MCSPRTLAHSTRVLLLMGWRACAHKGIEPENWTHSNSLWLMRRYLPNQIGQQRVSVIKCLPAHLVAGEAEDGSVECQSLYQVQLWPFTLKETVSEKSYSALNGHML